MKIIVRCPRCRKDVAIDRDDQLPLPAARMPDPEIAALKIEIARLEGHLRDQASRNSQLSRENATLRSTVYDTRVTASQQLLRTQQQEIVQLKSRNRALQTTLDTIKPQAAAKFFDAQNSEEGYLVLNGSAASPFPNVQY